MYKFMWKFGFDRCILHLNFSMYKNCTLYNKSCNIIDSIFLISERYKGILTI
jgi:hypothetical protein